MPLLWLKHGDKAPISFFVNSDGKFKLRGDGSISEEFDLDPSTVEISNIVVPCTANGWTEATVADLGFIGTTQQTPLLVTGAAGGAASTTAVGASAGMATAAGAAPITITIFDPYETPDIYDVKFKSPQKFDQWMDRGNITSVFKDGTPPGVHDFGDLVPGATYTTALRSIPASVANLESHKEHLVLRREQELASAIVDDLVSTGAQAEELIGERVVQGSQGHIAVRFVDANGQIGYVVGSVQTHVSGDADVGALEKVEQRYKSREPFASHPVQLAFMSEVVKADRMASVKDACKRKGVWLYARIGRSISKVQLRAATPVRFGLA